MILSKVSCVVCHMYPVYIDNETGELWDDQDATEAHDHYAAHRADDDGMPHHPRAGGETGWKGW